MNGCVMSEGSYENDSREGHFNIYNENGDLIKVMFFVNNTLTSETTINPLLRTASLVDTRENFLNACCLRL